MIVLDIICQLLFFLLMVANYIPEFLDFLEIPVPIDFGIVVLLLDVQYLSELIFLKLVYHILCLLLLALKSSKG